MVFNCVHIRVAVSLDVVGLTDGVWSSTVYLNRLYPTNEGKYLAPGHNALSCERPEYESCWFNLHSKL